MNISINKPNNFKRVVFKKFDTNKSLSDWITFEFKIKRDIQKTGLLFHLEMNVNEFYFQNRNGINSRRHKFGTTRPLNTNDILQRRVRFYTPNSLNDIDSMNFTVKLFSNLDELLHEEDVILKVKSAEDEN